MNKRQKRRGLSYAGRRTVNGLVFLSPWLIGVTAFFVYPFISTFLYMFHDVTLEPGGMKMEFTGLKNLREVFINSPTNVRMITEALASSFGTVILIMLFSIFAAVLLNQKFHGRAVVRAIFALPIIVSSGILLSVFKEDLFVRSIQSDPSTIFQSTALQDMLQSFGLDVTLVQSISDMINRIMDIVWQSGVQILLFLAALQSVPRVLYEVSSAEGATTWQTFWKVTIPLISPYILLNGLYSIIDSFTFYDNPVMKEVMNQFNDMNYEVSSALSMVYFAIVLVITLAAAGLASRHVYSAEK